MNNSFKIKKGLVVEGDARVTGAILDSTNAPGTSGQVLTSTVTGTDWKSLAEISGVDGTGTANYLSKWSDADTITNSIVYDNGTNVGIGTASPAAKLVLYSSSALEQRVLHESNGTTVLRRDGAISYLLSESGLEANRVLVLGSQTSAGGTIQERMRITSAGNVGIGTTSPSSRLDVVSPTIDTAIFRSSVSAQTVTFGSTTNTLYSDIILKTNAGNAEIFKAGTGYTSYGGALALNIYNSSGAIAFHPNSSANAMFIATNSNVGIGTTSPAYKLDVSGDIHTNSEVYLDNNAYLRFKRFSGGLSIQTLGIPSGTDDVRLLTTGDFNVLNGSLVNLMTIKNAGNVGIGTSSPAAPLHIYKSDTYSAIVSRADWNIAPTRLALGAQYGVLGYISTGIVETTNDTTYIALNYKNGLSTYAEGLRVYNNGNVGIGTTSPGAKLDVTGLTNIGNSGADGALGEVLRFTLPGHTGQWMNSVYSSVNAGTNSGILKFSLATGLTSQVDVMTLRNSGNVGIGTTSPSSKLHVEGGTVMATGGTSNGKNIQLYVNDSYGYLTTSAPKFYLDKEIRVAGGLIGSYNESLQLRTSGTTRMYIDNSSGNVGIGLTDPQAKLEVAGGTQDFQLRNLSTQKRTYFGTNNSGDLQVYAYETGVGFHDILLAVDNGTSAGNVGIGTPSPGAKLSVHSAVNSPAMEIVPLTDENSADTSVIRLWGTKFGTTNRHSEIRNVTDGSTANNELAFNTNGNERLRIASNGNVGIGTTNPDAKLEVRADGWGTLAEMVRFSTNAAGSGYVNSIVSKQSTGAGSNTILGFDLNTGVASVQSRVLTLLGDGNVGIGTTNMHAKLSIRTTSHSTGISINRAADNTAAMYLGNDGNVNAVIASNNSDLLFGRDISGTFTERMRMTNDGNVGIGTTNPGTKLQVAGTIRATGTTGIVDVDPLYGAFRFYNGSTFYGGFYNDAVLSAGNAVDLVSYVATGDYYIGSATTAKAVKVEQGGNVGIGTTSPTEKLDVNGVVNATSFSAGGTAGFTGMVNFPSNPPGSQMLEFQGGLLVGVS